MNPTQSVSRCYSTSSGWWVVLSGSRPGPFMVDEEMREGQSVRVVDGRVVAV